MDFRGTPRTGTVLYRVSVPRSETSATGSVVGGHPATGSSDAVQVAAAVTTTNSAPTLFTPLADQLLCSDRSVITKDIT